MVPETKLICLKMIIFSRVFFGNAMSLFGNPEIWFLKRIPPHVSLFADPKAVRHGIDQTVVRGFEPGVNFSEARSLRIIGLLLVYHECCPQKIIERYGTIL